MTVVLTDDLGQDAVGIVLQCLGGEPLQSAGGGVLLPSSPGGRRGRGDPDSRCRYGPTSPAIPLPPWKILPLWMIPAPMPVPRVMVTKRLLPWPAPA